MAAELVTPIDEYTGLPPLIAPKYEWLPLNLPEIADQHHAWHPGQELKTNLAGIALRNSLLEVTARESHNESEDAYHRFYRGPAIPTNETDIFRRCVVACAGVIPETVIDIQNGEPGVRPITTKERWYFRIPAENDEFGYRYVKYNYEPIRNFFKDFIFKQKLTHLREGLFDEFLHTKDQTEKLKIGKLLIANAVAVASDDVREPYYAMRRQGLTHPGMPQEVQTMVGHKLGNSESRFSLVQQFDEHLRAA